MQVKFMQDRIGEQFSGVISGVVERGVYIELSGNKCEGMVRPPELPGDLYIYDERNYSFVGQKTKTVFQLGDRVTIEVKSADPIKRHLDFALLGHDE